jgi:electron transfer flavoprotein alpha subunit
MALMFGSALHETAIEVVSQTGVGRIMVADAAEFDGPLIAARVATIDAVLARAPVDAVLFAPSLVAPELAGTLGATLGAGVAWGLTDLSLDAGALKAIRPVNDDSEIVDVTWSDGPALAVFRSFSGEASPSSRRGTIEHVPPATARNVPRIVRQERAESSSQNRLEDARIVVAGGRGVGSAEGLDLVRDLAGAMGAAFGVSLPVVDSGWAPRDRQVGQTGTVIAPDLYVACGMHDRAISSRSTTIPMRRSCVGPTSRSSATFMPCCRSSPMRSDEQAPFKSHPCPPIQHWPATPYQQRLRK